MTDMPYLWTKGPILAALDARYSHTGPAPAAERFTIYKALGTNAVNVTLGGSLDALAYPFGGFTSATALKKHVNEDWFGLPVDASGNATAGQPAGKETTGYWKNWHGDAHGIFRETLMVAIEVSVRTPRLGMANLVAAPHTAPALWPIEFFWICGAPVFQGFVSWRADPSGNGGHVIVTLVTPPPTGSGQLDLSLVGGGKVFSATEPAGMVVVGQPTEWSKKLVPTPFGGMMVNDIVTTFQELGADPAKPATDFAIIDRNLGFDDGGQGTGVMAWDPTKNAGKGQVVRVP